MAPEVHERHGDLLLLVPIIYRLALRNINMNAQNEHGNTCLHLACLRPNSDALCPHLIRIGETKWERVNVLYFAYYIGLHVHTNIKCVLIW